MATKISQLPELTVLNGNEVVPAVAGGVTVKFTLNKIKNIITKSDISLGNVDNTSDADKPVSTATAAALDQKANLVHGHSVENITGLQEALDGKAASTHGHDVSEITGVDALLAGKADVSHAHDLNSITGLPAALDGKANTVHTHTKDQINGLNDDLSFLQQQLNNKASSLHSHGAAEIADLNQAIDARVAEIVTAQPGGLTTEQVAAIATDTVAPLLLNKSDVGHTHGSGEITDLDSFVDGKVSTAIALYASQQPPALTSEDVSAIVLSEQHVIVPNLEW